MGRSDGSSSSKDRLKWTKELHDLFEKAVHQIGGPDRATPKGILKAMGIPGLTIFHVKSHLQKYRMSVFTREEDHIRGKSERRSLSEMLPNFGVTSAAQLNEALHIQMVAQTRLNDQFEVQRSLKTKIEAQTRFLDKIMEEYNNRAPSTKPFKPYSPVLSLPSLSEEFESDSEDACTSDLMSGDEVRARKRIKSQDNNAVQEINRQASFNSFLDLQNFRTLPLDGTSNDSDNLYTDRDFPWNVGVYQLPMLPALYNNPLN